MTDTALSSGKDVAETAKQETRNVATETKRQAASLLDTVRTEVGQQTGAQQNRIAETIHSLSEELGSMASSSEESGPLTDLAHQAADKSGELASWLQEREPADVLEAVRSYARRRPGSFLALCGLAGVVAGRLTRSAVATHTSLDSKGSDSKGSDSKGSDSKHGSGSQHGSGSGHRRELGRGDSTSQPRGRAAVTPASAPATGMSTGMSTGVHAGSVESSGPASAAVLRQAQDADRVNQGPQNADRVNQGPPDRLDPTVTGSGYVGTTRSLDDPNAELDR